MLESFIHIGEEVYGFDIFYEKEDQGNNLNENETMNNDINVTEDIEYKTENNTQNKIFKINNSSKEEIKSNEYLHNKINNKKNKEIDIKKINFITLDINGNVNLYKDKKEITLFNMYKLNSITQDHKDKQFFSMGYAYFIKTNLNYFCISSDHGCFLIKKNEK